MAMKTYEFIIIASGLDPEADDFESRFYDAGCDDATISFQRGHIIAEFARQAESMDDAIASARDCVISVGATVERVEPDPLVSLADMAARTGMSRAAMTQYAKGQRAKGFPAPVARVTTDNPLWDWASVAHWLWRRNKIPEDAAIEADALSEANKAIERMAARVRRVARGSAPARSRVDFALAASPAPHSRSMFMAFKASETRMSLARSEIDPTTLSAALEAFYAAWTEIESAGVLGDRDAAHNILTRRIVEAAVERGEREPDRLKAYALEGFNS